MNYEDTPGDVLVHGIRANSMQWNLSITTT